MENKRLTKPLRRTKAPSSLIITKHFTPLTTALPNKYSKALLFSFESVGSAGTFFPHNESLYVGFEREATFKVLTQKQSILVKTTLYIQVTNIYNDNPR